MSVRIAALSLLIVLALSGCGRQFVSPDVRPQDATFIGIRKALDNAPVVDVVYVHGMCTHTAEDIATKLDELLTQMHVPHAPLTPATLPKPSDLPYGGLLYEASYPSGSSKLRLHAILWSPITNPYKQRLCYDQTAKSSFCPLNSPSPPRRAVLNANIKDGLLDNCLSDAVVYLGPAKEKIYRALRAGLLRSTSGGLESKDTKLLALRAATQEAPLFFVSESLGSKMLFDTLSRMLRDNENNLDAQAVRNTLGRTYEVFMAANQLPLLDLADEANAKAAQAAPDSLRSLAGVYSGIQSVIPKGLFPERLHALARPPRLQLIAFTDPNDLLSFELNPSSDAEVTPPDVDVVNVVVSNRPTYLWLFENPLTAHTTYLENDGVAQLIACGRPPASTCAAAPAP